MRPFAAAGWLEAVAPARIASELPVLPLRDAVLFPEQRLLIGVGRPASLAALEAARVSPGHHVLAVAQREEQTDEPQAQDLQRVGCVARVFSEQERANAGCDVVLLGRARAQIVGIRTEDGGLVAGAELIPDAAETDPPLDATTAMALQDLAVEVVRRAFSQSKSGARRTVDAIASPGRIADLVLGYLDLPIAEHQRWLEEPNASTRVAFVLGNARRVGFRMIERQSWTARAPVERGPPLTSKAATIIGLSDARMPAKLAAMDAGMVSATRSILRPLPAALVLSTCILACAIEASAPASSPATVTVEMPSASASAFTPVPKIVPTTTPRAASSSAPTMATTKTTTTGLHAAGALKLEGDVAAVELARAINTQVAELQRCVPIIRATDGVVGSLNLQVLIAKDGKVATELQSPINDDAKRCLLDGARGWVVRGAGAGKAMLLLNLE
jgi:Lon protease-like protein